MANRNTLHKDRLGKFIAYLDAQGIAHRPGKGTWQVLQVMTKHAGWQCIHSRMNMPEHYTIQDQLYPLVREFINYSRIDETLGEIVEREVTLDQLNFKLDLILEHLHIRAQ